MYMELSEMICENNRPEYIDTYNQMRTILRTEFLNYRSAPPEKRQFLWDLMEKHKLQSFGAEDRRRHNSFVLMYLTEQKFSPKEIAQIQRIRERTFWKDLNHVLDDLMVLAFGIAGIKPCTFQHQASLTSKDSDI